MTSAAFDSCRHGGKASERHEECLLSLLDGTSHAIVATDPDGILTSFNRGAENMLGYRAEELIGRYTPEIIHDPVEMTERAAELRVAFGEPDVPLFEALVAKARHGQIDEREWTYVRKDGSRVPVLLTITALRRHDGAIRGYLGIAVDIGARKRLAEATAHAETNRMAGSLIRAIAKGVVAFEERPPHRVLFVNPHAETLVGMRETEARGHPLSDLLEIDPETGACCNRVADWPKCPHGGSFEATVHTRAHPSGFPARLAFAPVADGGGGLAVLTLEDIGAWRRSEEKHRLSDKVFEYSAEAIVITDADAAILAVNPAFTFLTGYRPDEVIGKNPNILKSGRHDDAFYAAMWDALLTSGRWEGELWDRRKDGSFYPKWLSINAVRDEGRITHYVALFADISERKETEDRIRFLAEHDHLTGLPNRRLLEARANQLISSSRRRDAGLAMMMIDLDRFKNVNDTLGHAAGDQLLIEVARRLVASVRASDTVVRLGGDEFVVLLEDLHAAHDAAAVAAKIREALNRPIEIGDRALHTPPSIGIALYPENGEDFETLLRNADTALYQVKATGRNAWLFYADAMNDAVRNRLRLEEDLRSSLAAGRFCLHFQPQFDVATHRIVAWEALLRWPHPTRGSIPPEEFIPIAEETGLILPLGNWVLHAACREAKRWEEQGLGCFRVGVNLSARQFADAGLVDSVAAALKESGLDGSRLELEITEGMLMGRGTPETLQRLKALGVVLTLDDFGTGYSSLSYLKSFAVDRIKIDRSFVADLDQGNNGAIVRAVISMAQALDLSVVAEGVETGVQKDFLVDHGCREVQGFLRGRPMPSEEIPGFISRIACATPA